MSENRSMQYAEILSKLIKVETISSRESKDITKFLGFHEVLRETYPNLFADIEIFSEKRTYLTYFIRRLYPVGIKHCYHLVFSV